MSMFSNSKGFPLGAFVIILWLAAIGTLALILGGCAGVYWLFMYLVV